MKFKCWVSDNCDEEDAKEYDSYDAESAAEAHAESEWDDSAGECGAGQIINVRDLESGAVQVFNVSMDWSPNFYAGAKP